MGNIDYARLAKDLKPYLAPEIRTALNAALAKAALPTIGSGSSGSVTPPGTGTDVHVLATDTALGSKHTVSGLTAGMVLRALSSTTAAFGVLQHGQLGGVGPNDHHNQSHAYDSSADHTGTLSWPKVNKSGASLADLPTRLYADLQTRTHDIIGADHSYTGGAALDVFGLSAPNTLAKLTPSSSPGAASAILRTDALGQLGVTTMFASIMFAGPRLYSSGALTIDPVGTLTLGPASNVVAVGASALLKSAHYTSQLTGWGITYAGAGDFRYLYADELHAKAFIADLEQALAGGQIIAKSVSTLSRPYSVPAAGSGTTIYVKDLPSAENMAVFQSGDIIRLRSFSRAGGSLSITNCWGVVTGYTDLPDKEQSWTFTRSTGSNSGAMLNGTVIAADSIVLDYGTSGNGFYEVNAIDGANGVNSPYAQVVTWTGHPATGQTLRTRTGNLTGVGFGVANEYGLYAGNGVLTSSAYLRMSNAAFELHNVPINLFNGAAQTGEWRADGTFILSSEDTTDIYKRDFLFDPLSGAMRIGRGGAGVPNLFWTGADLKLRMGTDDVIVLDSSGASYFAGRMTIGTSGEIVQGTGTLGAVSTWSGTWGSFTGLRLGRDGNVGRLGGYASGVLQAGFDSSGRIVAGAGRAYIDANGINFSSDATIPVTAGLRWMNSGSLIGSSYARGWLDPIDQITRGEVVLQAVAEATAAISLVLRATNQAGYETTTVLEALGSGPTTARVVAGAQFGDSWITLSADTMTFNGGANFSGAATIASNLTLGGALNTTSAAPLELKRDGRTILVSGVSGNAAIQLGYERTSDGATFVDLFTNALANTTPGLRIIRNTGANGSSQFAHRGTGAVGFVGVDACDFTVATNNTTRLTVGSTGLVGIGVAPSTQQLKVLGSVAVGGDQGGTSGYMTLTNATAAISTGTITIRSRNTSNGNNAGFIKIYIDGTAKYIPYVD